MSEMALMRSAGRREPTLPPLRTFIVTYYDPTSGEPATVEVTAHTNAIDLEGVLVFVTYVIMEGQPVPQRRRLFAPHNWVTVDEKVDYVPSGLLTH